MLTPPFRHVLFATALSAACLSTVIARQPAIAQTTTSQSALDALGPTEKPAAGKSKTRKTQAVHHGAVHARPGPPAHAAAKPPAKRQASGHAPAATIPAGPPAAPVFTAPVINVPLHPPAPPPPVPVVQTATGSATPIDDGVRIGFGDASADLNPRTMQALHDFAATVKANPDARAILDAAAAGSPDDPSTPRRLALSRGLAARAVLINDGIASTRIYVRMDPRAEAGSDHVDLRLERNDQNTTQSATTPTTTPPAVSTPAPGSTPP